MASMVAMYYLDEGCCRTFCLYNLCSLKLTETEQERWISFGFS